MNEQQAVTIPIDTGFAVAVSNRLYKVVPHISGSKVTYRLYRMVSTTLNPMGRWEYKAQFGRPDDAYDYISMVRGTLHSNPVNDVSAGPTDDNYDVSV